MYVLPWGQFGLRFYNTNNNNFNLPKLKGEHRIGPHNQDIISIIIGSILGDAYAERREFLLKNTKIKVLGNTRIIFHQSDKNIEYLMWLWKKFSESGYTSKKKPKITKIVGKKNVIYYSLKFHTWTFSSFNWIHDLFYVKGKKSIPNNIEYYLTPLALAIWIMDDGSKDKNGILLHTNAFKYEEVILLNNVLVKKYFFKTSIRKKDENQWIIYIHKESMENLNKIILPFMCTPMLKKLHICVKNS